MQDSELEYLQIQKVVQQIQECLNQRIASALEFLNLIESLPQNNNIEAIHSILDEESAVCSNFLQQYVRIKGFPLIMVRDRGAADGVIGDCSTSEELVDREVDGVLIAMPCNAATAKQLIGAFQQIMQNDGNLK